MWKTWMGELDIHKKTYQAKLSIASVDEDKSSWPISLILVRDGVVVKYVQALDSITNPIPNMLGWDHEQVVSWINAYEGPKKNTLRIIITKEVSK
jgi:hypothetical protein